jgi:CubicO group peptidase (beta-lactamase class C family)
MARLGGLPLLCSPGTGWNYGMSTDVCGRLVEVMSGQALDEFLRERIFEPLGMVDTGFCVRAGQAPRLAANYVRGPARTLREIAPGADARAEARPTFLSGAGGLVSTVTDYHRFARMLLGRGELDGVRLLGSRTLDYMTRNHLPGGRSLNELGQATFSETAMEGTGFGLGFAVVLDAAANQTLCSEGEYHWGGAASTAFWVDPVEEVIVVFLTQLVPSNTYPIRRQLRAAVYQALVD